MPLNNKNIIFYLFINIIFNRVVYNFTQLFIQNKNIENGNLYNILNQSILLLNHVIDNI